MLYVWGARSGLGLKLVVGKLAAENKGQTRLSRAGGKLYRQCCNRHTACICAYAQAIL